MTQTTSLPLPDRLTELIEGVMNDVAEQVGWGWVVIPLIKLVWRRLRHMKARFASIMARFRAGRLAAGPLPTPGRAAAAPRPADGPHQSHGPHPWHGPQPSDGPRPQVPPQRAGEGRQKISVTLFRRYELEEILDDPETAALVAGAPQPGRVLRPLCRMTAVRPPAWLRLPRRARSKPARKAGHWTMIRLGAVQLWRKPCSLWPTREEAEKFDAKIRVWVEE